MIIVSNALISLFLTILVSFATPIILVSVLLSTLFVVSYLPGSIVWSQVAMNSILEFLAVFGSGYPVQGILVIGCSGAFVGGLFDLFNLYCDRSIKGN